MANTANEGAAAAGVANQINQLAERLQVSKDDVQKVVDVVAEHIDAFGGLPKDDADALRVFNDQILPQVMEDERLSELADHAPPPPPLGTTPPPLGPVLAGAIILGELALAGYAIYREVRDVPTVHADGSVTDP